MKSLDTFQIVVLAVFGFFIIAGLIILAITKGGSSGNAAVPITIWGTAKGSDVTALFGELAKKDKTIQSITYVEKRADAFDNEFVNAIADGVPPDLVLLPQDMLFKHRTKLSPIPYSMLSARDLSTNYVDEAQIFLTASGVLAVPFSIDPLLMYWNRDLFNGAGIANPPRFWDELPNIVPNLTKRDSSFGISRSGVALGEFRNITNAKDILSALILQLGNPIATPSTSGYVSTLAGGSGVPSAASAVNFYTEFANPLKPDYSWSRSLPNSTNFFIGGNLAMYFGYASELQSIRAKNPNLNFDVTYLPALRDTKTQVTFGRLMGLAVVRTSPHASAAALRAIFFGGQGPVAFWAAETGAPPVRRDLLAASPADPYQVVLYNSALQARGWVDPGRSESNGIFQNMVEAVTGGLSGVSDSVGAASQALGSLFQ